MKNGSSETTEDYLKQIYDLSLDGGPVKTSQIAEALDVSPAAVSVMIKRLGGLALVEYRPYHGVTLTEVGRERALGVVRRHRLWETFLHDVLGFAWTEVHEHACRLEHATDAQLADALDEYLGHPSADPHGHPIPHADGTVDDDNRRRLSEIEPGQSCTIDQCTKENPALLDYLTSRGLTPGVSVQVLERAPFGGPVTVECAGERFALGVEVARSLIVTPPE